jgi:hypothetical protein
VDLGPNHGEFALEMSRRFGGRYYLVEANPEPHNTLRSGTSFPELAYVVAPQDAPVRFSVAKNDKESSILLLPEMSVYDCTLARTFVALTVSRPQRTDVLFVNLAHHRLAGSKALCWKLRYDHTSHVVPRVRERFRH